MKMNIRGIFAAIAMAAVALWGGTAEAGTYCISNFSRGDIIKAGTKIYASTYKVLFVTIKPKWSMDVYNGDSKPSVYVKGGTGGTTWTAPHDYRVGILSSKLFHYVQLERIFNVTHNPNGGSGWANSTCYYAQLNAFLSSFRPSKDGKNFWGWAWDNPNASRPDTYPGWWFYRNYDCSLYAVWRYNCAFVAGKGGTVSYGGRNNVWERESTSSTATPSEGYTFSHWSGPTGNSYNKTVTVARNGTWTANFKGIPYKVRYNANGGSGAMADTSLVYGTPTALTESTFKRQGYICTGWAKSPTGPKVYDDGEAISDGTTTPNETIDLYAVWVAPVNGWVENITDWGTVRSTLQNGYNARLGKSFTQSSVGDAAISRTSAPDGDSTWPEQTLDFNGYTITMYSQKRLLTVNYSGSTVVLRSTNNDSGVCGLGKDNKVSGATAGIWIKSGKVIVESGKYWELDCGSWNGGFCQNQGTLEIRGGYIWNCDADYNGGAIDNQATLIMSGGTISFCWGRSPTPATDGGGAVLNRSSMTMSGGTITQCQGANGGAIQNNGTLTISGGEIYSNNSWYDSSGPAGGLGGGIYNGGKLYIKGGYIHDNTSYCGGAVYNKGTLYVYDGKFVNNSAKNVSGDGYGGFCYSYSGCYSYIYGGYFSGNSSNSSQAHIYHGCGWAQNGCLYGGMFTTNPTDYSQCHDCWLLQDGNSVWTAGSRYVVGKKVAVNKDGLLTSGTYTFNPKAANYTDYVYSEAVSSGSGTSWKLSSRSPALCTTWAQVKANLDAGNDVKLMANITGCGNGHCYPAKDADVMLDLNGYTMTQYAKNYIFEFSEEGTGTLTIFDSSADQTGKIVGNGTTTGGDGGNFARVYAAGRGLILESGTISGFTLDNDGGNGGGAIKVFAGASFTMNGGAIENCTCDNNGGAVECAGTVTINGGTISGCTANSCGGAINVTGGTLNLAGGVISNNWGKSCGGGVRASAGTINLSGTKIAGNKTPDNGGGIQMDGAATLNMTGGEISGNFNDGAAANYGGAGVLAWTSSTVNLYGGVITNNATAGTTPGGAVLFNGAAMNVYGGLFAGNTASADPVFHKYGTNPVTVYGGVFGTDPIVADAVVLGAGSEQEVAKGWQVIGQDLFVTAADGAVAGLFTFDPLDSMYSSAEFFDRSRSVTTACDTTPKTWRLKTTGVLDIGNATEFKKAIQNGCSMNLTADIALDAAAKLEAPTDAVIDLKGHALTAAADTQLFILSIDGSSLKIIDTVGGGACAGNGTVAAGGAFAAVADGAKFTFAATNATVRGFTSANGAGAIELADGAAAEVIAGVISNCVGTTAGAVYVPSNSVFTVGGIAVIAGNLAPADFTNNVFLAKGALVTVSTNAPFAAGAEIGLTLGEKPEGEGAIAVTTAPDETAGFVSNVGYFKSDLYGYTLQDGDGNRVWMYVRYIEILVSDCEYLSNRVVRVNGEAIEKKDGIYQVLIGTTNLTATYTAERGYAWLVGGKYVTERTFGPASALVDPLDLGVDMESPVALVAAKIGETEYPFLEDAVAAVGPTERITLCADCILDDTLEIAKPVFIDFCGNTISNSIVSATAFSVVDGGTLKLTDNHDDSEGRLFGAISTNATGVVKIFSGLFECSPTGMVAKTSFIKDAKYEGLFQVAPKEGPAGEIEVHDQAGKSAGTINPTWETLAKNGLEEPEELDNMGANGLRTWQSLSLGLDPKDATALPLASPVQQADGDKVVVDIDNISDNNLPAQTTVKYQLMASDDKANWQEVGGLKDDPNGVELEKKVDGSYYKFYKTKAVIVTGGNP